MTTTLSTPVGQRAVVRVPQTLTRGDAVRFLHRASFGGSVDDVQRLMREGVEGWLRREFAEQPSNTLFALTRRDGWWGASIWQRYLTGNALLRKRIGYALSQIFVVSFRGSDSEATSSYADLLERHAFGTFRELLDVITRSVAMGHYLTYAWNIKGDERTGRQPDENYAREVLQLFSIGLVELNEDGTEKRRNGRAIPTYGQDDVRGLARVFTGWYPNDRLGEYHLQMSRPMINNPDWHEPGVKRFLGVTIPAGTSGEQSLRIALDAIAAHPNVGPFIGRQLIQRLVTSNPSPGYVRRVARVFANDGAGVRGNLRAVVRAVLLDDEAWATPGATTGKLREPVLRYTTVMRAMGVRSSKVPWEYWTFSDSHELGQGPYYAPSVFNFYRPGYVPPQTEIGDRGMVAPEFQLATESSVLGWINFLARMLQWPPDGISYDRGPLERLAGDPAALVAEVEQRLTGGRLSSSTRSLVVDTVAATEVPWSAEEQRKERVNAAVVLVAGSTEFLAER